MIAIDIFNPANRIDDAVILHSGYKNTQPGMVTLFAVPRAEKDTYLAGWKECGADPREMAMTVEQAQSFWIGIKGAYAPGVTAWGRAKIIVDGS